MPEPQEPPVRDLTPPEFWNARELPPIVEPAGFGVHAAVADRRRQHVRPLRGERVLEYGCARAGLKCPKEGFLVSSSGDVDLTVGGGGRIESRIIRECLFP